MGNGGAMRAAPLGAYFAGDLGALVEQARASAEVTHAHPDGQAGAIAVALAAAWAWQNRARRTGTLRRELLDFVVEHTPNGDTRNGVAKALAGLESIPAEWRNAREPIRPEAPQIR